MWMNDSSMDEENKSGGENTGDNDDDILFGKII